MTDGINEREKSQLLARQWCEQQGQGWSVHGALGEGGTAPVFEIDSPEGKRALKIFDAKFSQGKKGEIENKRISQQLKLKGHNCPYLVQIFEGGKFEDRLYLLMSRAPGTELEKRLKEVPRSKIRHIVDQVAQAAIFLKEQGLCHRDIKAANIFISDDFDHCTLLDISVIRDVYDPIGVGTDHEDQLPVLATARYSPPEYLFRLLEPGAKLWHALNVYQLGALLHDLIMREPMFQNEYEKSAENRYRFAWVVATVDPLLKVTDVDRDLVFTAQRALDKNWERRSDLTLEDFLADANVQQRHALQVLGINAGLDSGRKSEGLAMWLQRVKDLAENMEASILEYLREREVIPIHNIEPGQCDTAKSIQFQWNLSPSETSTGNTQVALHIDLQLLQPDMTRFGLSVELTMRIDGRAKVVDMKLPELQDEPSIEKNLFNQSIAAFEKLAVEIMHGNMEA